MTLATHRSLLAPIPWQQGCGPEGCYTASINISPLLMQEGMLLTMLAVILYCWRRGIRQAREGNDSQQGAMSAFKWQFSVLLLVLALAALISGPMQNALLASLSVALPLFFLGSLLTLSLSGLPSGYWREAGEQMSVSMKGW